MPVPRKRSCAQCRLAKTRCSLSSPKCTRCQTRTLECDYTEALPRAVPSGGSSTVLSLHGQQFSNPREAQHISGVPPIELATDPIDASLFSDFQMTDMQWVDSATDDADNILRNEASWFEFPFVESSLRAEIQEPLGPVSEMRYQSTKEDENYVVELSRKLVISELATLPWPSPQRIPKRFHTLLSLRPIESLGSELIVNHLLSTFQSYPDMLSTPSLPPFIHRYCCVGEMDLQHLGNSFDLPEPLANCLSFIPMFRSKTPMSDTFVMRTLFIEVQRLHNEFRIFDARMKLSAIQAITIYIILLSGEKDRCVTLSAVLVLAMGEIAASLQEQPDMPNCGLNGEFLNWKEWIYGESLRRTMTLLWLIQIIINVDIGISRSGKCHGFDEIPLPCSKMLWEAANETEWETRYRIYKSNKKGSDIPRIRDLRLAQQLNPTAVLDKSRAEDLQIWSSSIDSFGSLLMFAIR